MTRQEKYQTYLKLCAQQPGPQEPIYHQFARVASGLQADESTILHGLEHMRVRLDCGDFRINILLRMLYRYPDTPLVSAQAKEEIEDLLLDYDYWYGENAKFPGRQIIWTENHVMLFMTCEYLSAKLYPDKVFRFRSKTGRDTMDMLHPKLTEWIDMKLRIGFSEWDSNCYMEENMLSLLNLYDFSDDETLKRKACALLDVMTFSLALNSYQGNFCGTHGRTYTRMLLSERGAPTTLLEKLLWGKRPITAQDELLGLGSLALATSDYVPQPLIEAIALDDTLVLEDRQQQSFDVEDAQFLGKSYDTYEDMTLFWHNMAYTHVNVVGKMYEMCEKFGIMVNPAVYPEYRYVQECKKNNVEPEPCRVSTYMSRVNLMNYKTPDYHLSCAQDFRKGELGFQQHIWQATLADDAIIFTSHPGTLGVEDGRPDFWAGNHFHPKALQYRDTIVCMYHITEDCPLPYSHAYFPREKFDAVYDVGNWVFAKKGDGYAALYSQNGYTWTKEGRWADKELVCHSKQNVWICQMGRKAEYGSFLRFVSDVLRCEPVCTTTSVCYPSPHGAKICCGWEAALTVDGQPIQTRGYKRFDNALCQSAYGSGIYEICYHGDTLRISSETM